MIYSYLSNQVVHLKGNAGHGIDVIQREYIIDFFSQLQGDVNGDIDATVSNGSIRVLAGIGTNADVATYHQLGDPVSIRPNNNIVNGIVLSSISAVDVESQLEYEETKTMNLRS